MLYSRFAVFVALAVSILSWTPARAAEGAVKLSAPLQAELQSLTDAARSARGVERLTNENRARLYELSFLQGAAHSAPLPRKEAHELALLQVNAELVGGEGHLPEKDFERVIELRLLRGDDKSRPLAAGAAKKLAAEYLGIKFFQVRGEKVPQETAARILALNKGRLRAPVPDGAQLNAFKTLEQPVVSLEPVGPVDPAKQAQLAHVYDIDAPDSSVMFTVRHLVGTVVGRFGKFQGVFTYDKDKPESWEATANIETASLATTDAWRDEHLLSADFFDAPRCKTIELRGTSVSDVHGNAAKLHGDLTIHCITRPVVLDIEIGDAGPDAEGRQRVVVRGKTTVNRRDFGMTWDKPVVGSVFIGDQVDISIEVQGVARGS